MGQVLHGSARTTEAIRRALGIAREDWKRASGRPRNSIVEIAGPQRAPFNEIVARYLKAIGDPRVVVSDPEALYFGGRVEEKSLVPMIEARLGRIDLDEWLRRSQAKA
jgi:uncharacterized protein YbjT (DUF2867 family)